MERALIVGLGNPGKEFQGNRHNVGFQAVDCVAARYHVVFSRQKNHARVAFTTIVGRPVVLAKPQSFMNRSGVPVAGLMKFYKIAPENMIVAFDDLDLPAGTLRLRASGGSGGHNGLKSIIGALGTQLFPRVRIGIGRPPGRMDPAAYVLQDFAPDQHPLVRDVLERAADAVESWLQYGINLAMSRYNGPSNLGTEDQAR